MPEAVHAYSLASASIVFATRLLFESESKPMSTRLAAGRALTRKRTIFSSSRSEGALTLLLLGLGSV